MTKAFIILSEKNPEGIFKEIKQRLCGKKNKPAE